MAHTIQVIDAKKFVNALKKRKRKLRYSYVQSKQKGAKLIRYIDYANLLKILSDSVVELTFEEVEIENTPTTFTPSFDVEKVDIKPDDDPIDDEEDEEEDDTDDDD